MSPRRGHSPRRWARGRTSRHDSAGVPRRTSRGCRRKRVFSTPWGWRERGPAGTRPPGPEHFVPVVGALAVLAALGARHRAPDSKDALRALLAEPLGHVRLGAIAAGLLCFALWRLAQAVLDA
ncbi:MAG: DUF1206 domain-containing protein, partial [Xanthobacteraceae bacterium]